MTALRATLLVALASSCGSPLGEAGPEPSVESYAIERSVHRVPCPQGSSGRSTVTVIDGAILEDIHDNGSVDAINGGGHVYVRAAVLPEYPVDTMWISFPSDKEDPLYRWALVGPPAKRVPIAVGGQPDLFSDARSRVESGATSPDTVDPEFPDGPTMDWTVDSNGRVSSTHFEDETGPHPWSITVRSIESPVGVVPDLPDPSSVTSLGDIPLEQMLRSLDIFQEECVNGAPDIDSIITCLDETEAMAAHGNLGLDSLSLDDWLVFYPDLTGSQGGICAS